MDDFQLAQINIGRLIAPIDDPLIADFVAGLDPINALAEQSPGFIWRLQSEAATRPTWPTTTTPSSETLEPISQALGLSYLQSRYDFFRRHRFRITMELTPIRKADNLSVNERLNLGFVIAQ